MDQISELIMKDLKTQLGDQFGSLRIEAIEIVPIFNLGLAVRLMYPDGSVWDLWLIKRTTGLDFRFSEWFHLTTMWATWPPVATEPNYHLS
ncbi:MAG: hypothetical protein IPO08_22560 [Xanthomonadales bacterium]|nr:hypothetical protein [Xanthomonadales bacterium]